MRDINKAWQAYLGRLRIVQNFSGIKIALENDKAAQMYYQIRLGSGSYDALQLKRAYRLFALQCQLNVSQYVYKYLQTIQDEAILICA